LPLDGTGLTSKKFELILKTSVNSPSIKILPGSFSSHLSTFMVALKEFVWTHLANAASHVTQAITSKKINLGKGLMPPCRHKAAPEWQAKSNRYRCTLAGGLSTPGTCSKVEHLQRQRLMAAGESLDLRHQTLKLGIYQSFVQGDMGWGRGCDY
jgi:hypothetical protein